MGSKDEDGSGVLGWGKSVPVHSVQEIVRNDSLSVPEKYIQKENDRPTNSEFASLSPQNEIPIINLSLLSEGDEDERRKLDFACKEWGFFQITNHGIEEVLHKVKAATAAFFELPLEEKKKHAMALNDVQGYGQAYVVSEEQKLDWNDVLFLKTLPPTSRNMKCWPTIVPGFSEAVEQYAKEVENIKEVILANLSILMNMDKDGLKGLYPEMTQGMRFNYYPTCSRPDLVMGVSPHSDMSFITLLLQDDGITGLQVKHKGGWVPVKPIPNAIVVNLGDVMEAWSNGVYKSIEHRAVTNEKRARISIATFVLPHDESKIGPLDSMVDDDHHPIMYKTVKYIDYICHTLARKVEGKAHIEMLKL